MGLFTGSRELLGVDIGTHSVKIVQLKGGPTRWSLSKYGISEFTPALAAEVSPQERKTLITSTLKTLLSKTKTKVKKAATAVSGNGIIVRYVKFPKMTPSDLEKTIRFEAEPYIPFDIHDVNISAHILGDVIEDGQPKIEVVLVAAKKDILQERLEILQGAGLKPAVIDVDAFAVENAYEIIRNKDQEETVMLLNIGATTTNIAIVENGVSRVVRDVFVAGYNLTRSIQRNLQVDFREAESLKKESGLILADDEGDWESVSPGDERNLQVSSIIRPVVRELAGEVRRSIDYYQAQTGGEKNVDRVLLSGGTSKLKDLDKFLAKELGIPVEINNPFLGMDTSRYSEEELEAMGPFFAVAVGLATRREGDTE